MNKQMKIVGAITIGVVLILGLILGLVLKFNTNFEVGSYSEFTVSIDSTDKEDINKAIDTISKVVNSNGLKYDTTFKSVQDAVTKLTVRYQKTASDSAVLSVNQELNEKLGVDAGEHYHYESKINNAIGQTAIVLAIILVGFSIFSTIMYARFTGLVSLISGVVATCLYLSVTAIMRLTVGLSYFAILIILNLVIIYYEIILFESVDRNSSNQLSQISSAVVNNRKNMSMLAIGIAVVSLLFVVVAPTSVKFLSIGLMFVPVICLGVGLYITPFVMAVFARLFSKGRSSLKNK